MQDIKQEIGNVKGYYGRGSNWLQIILNIGIITANIKLFESTINNIGIPISIILITAIIGYPLICITLGKIDDKHGILKEENNFGWLKTPIAMKLVEKVNKIYDKICEDKENEL